MKRFPYKFTPLIKTLFIGVLCLGVAVIVMNTIRFAKMKARSSYDYVTLICTVAVGIAALVFGISILVKSYFMIDDKFVTLRWGFFKNQIPLDSIKKLVKMEKSNKLAIYYNEDNYYVIFIHPDTFDSFSKYIVEKNKDIIVEYTTG